MDIEKFEKMISDPGRSKKDLMTMYKNARQKGAVEHAAAAKAKLDKRFPGWDTVKSRRGGARPTVARYLDEERQFPTSKDAYVWLIEKFIKANPSLFEDPSQDTVFVALGQRRNYFGKGLKKMFHGSPDLAENRSNYTKLTNGWFANLNLNNAQKFDILMRFSALARMRYPDEWDWAPVDPTKALMDQKTATMEARKVWEEIMAVVKDGKDG